MFNLEKIAELERQLENERNFNDIISGKLRNLDESLDNLVKKIENLTNEIVTLRDKVIPAPIVTYDKTGIELVEELRRFPIELHQCIPCRMIPYGILEDIIKKNKTDN